MSLKGILQETLDNVGGTALAKGLRDAEWTTEIKKALVSMGKQQGYQAHTAGIEDADGGEWLYDLCWLEYKDRWLMSCPLAMECEWAPSQTEISDDFQKLLLASANFKLMVYAAKDDAKRQVLGNTLAEYIHRFNGNCDGQAYLLSCWVADLGRFHHEAIEI